MTGASFAPAEAFSLLLRLCFEVRSIDNVRGSNMPILMLLHVVVQLRSLAGVCTEYDTNAFVTYLINSFSSVAIENVAEVLATGLKVDAEKLDIAERVIVRWCTGCVRRYHQQRVACLLSCWSRSFSAFVSDFAELAVTGAT